ncbi:uncharacterized protein LOC132626435 [Lycium barbarum]|uniref:uncharacterized protein LOC132626435 n=1 Tax=Lycium barbarum TaxID=112863 RepID=UPI00293F657A|nr:uncharacterized protein LOC132626435 [Lycium barbarum]
MHRELRTDIEGVDLIESMTRVIIRELDQLGTLVSFKAGSPSSSIGDILPSRHGVHLHDLLVGGLIARGYSGAGQSSMTSGFQMHRNSGQTKPSIPQCPRCGRRHPGECRLITGACFSCGLQGHTMRECRFGGGSDSAAQPTGSVAGSSSSVAMRPMGQGIPTPAGRGRGRGRVSSSSGPSNRIYALASRQDQAASPNVVTGILSIFSRDVYALIDPGSTLSYIYPFVASKIGIKPEFIEPFEVATPVYRNCSVVIYNRCTKADLIELDMTEFDVIMGWIG